MHLIQQSESRLQLVDEFAKLLKTGVQHKEASPDSTPTTIFSAHKVMLTLVDDRIEAPLYLELWDRIERTFTQMEDQFTSESFAAFTALVHDTQEATMKVESTDQSITSVAATTMRYYELNRRLDKLMDAFPLR